MIQITSSGNDVVVKVKTGMYKEAHKTFVSMHNVGNDQFAELLSEKINTTLTETIEAIRKQEYDAGYRDARAKRKKRGWFFSLLEVRDYPK